MKRLGLTSLWLAGAIALGTMQTAWAQESHLILEMTIGETGRTVFRCSAADDVRSDATDCSGNSVQAACDDRAMVVDRNDGGACFIEDGTQSDATALDRAQQETSRMLRTAE